MSIMSSRLEARITRILSELLNSGDYVTLEELSVSCGVTRRSIQNHMHKLEKWFEENGLAGVRLIKKPGRGIRISADNGDLADLRKKLSEGDEVHLYDDTNRRTRLLKLLLLTNEELTIGFLADFFYCGRSVILRDMEWVSNWLEKYGCRLSKIQSKGIRALGGEVCKRNAIAAFFDICSEDAEDGEKSFQSTFRVTEHLFAKYKAVYPKIDMPALASIIDDAEKRFDFFLMDEYYVTLLTHMIICASRLDNEDGMEDDSLRLDDFTPVLETAKFIVDRMCKTLNVAIPQAEVAYICLHLMSHYIRDETYDGGGNCEALAITLIEFVETQVGERFSNDKLLFFGLQCHLKTSLFRIKNRIHLSALQERPVSLDARIVDAVGKAGFLYEDICGEAVTLPEEEIQALAVYFMMARERRVQRFRAVLLSSMGVVRGVAMRDFLNSELEMVDIVDVVFFPFQLEMIPSNRYDFVISTLDVAGNGKPVAYLKNMPQTVVMGYLRNFIKQLQ
jgi:transcriptional antiterminator